MAHISRLRIGSLATTASTRLQSSPFCFVGSPHAEHQAFRLLKALVWFPHKALRLTASLLGAIPLAFGCPDKERGRKRNENMYLNSVTLTGFLGRDAESKTLTHNGKMTILSVATKNSWKDQETGEWESRTEWYRCVASGRLAEATSLLKSGDHVHIQGQIQTREYVGSKS
jgi:hypothetical protein